MKYVQNLLIIRRATLVTMIGLLAVGIGCAPHQSSNNAFADPVPGSVEHLIKPADLPVPHATPSSTNGPTIVHQEPNMVLHAPPGFTVNLFADHLDNPRNMTLAPDGTVFVALSGPNQIAALRDTKGNGVADKRTIYASDLRQPFGLAFHGGYLYVGNTDSVVRFAYKKGDIKATGAPETIVPNLPAKGYHNHWTRDVCFSADGKTMFVSVGSEGNDEIESDARRAAILAFDPDGGNYRIYASGLRNPVGLAIDPYDNQLWSCVNERDGLGDNVPTDYATHVVESGFYGWPYSYIGQHPDPTFGTQRADLIAKAITPDVLLEAHCAAVNIAFSTSKTFPEKYRGGAFVSMHGSWNRSIRSGYKVVYIPFREGKPVDSGYYDFLTGFKVDDATVWGRPVGLLVAADGSLLVCDDGSGKIWRVSANK